MLITAGYGVILAGGRASRMGYTDKGLLALGGKPILQWIVDAASAQVDTLLLSINHNSDRYDFLNLHSIPDYDQVYGGPLVGIVSAMRYLNREGIDGDQLIACFPADVPWFPKNLVQSLGLQLRAGNCEVALARQGDQLQPLFSVWTLSVLPKLERAVADGLLGPKLVLPQLRSTIVDFPDQQGMFHNINTREDLVLAKQYLNSR